MAPLQIEPEGANVFLELGNGQAPAASYGIVLNASASSLLANPGWFEWVQLITTDNVQYLDAAGEHACSPKNWNPSNPQLDTTYPYSSNLATSQGGNLTDDSPQTPVSVESAQSFAATTYLMWDPAIPPNGQGSCTPAKVTEAGVMTPSTCASIPIPLGYYSWRFSGCAVNTLSTATGFNGTTVQLLCGTETPTPQKPSSFVSGSNFPEWQYTLPSNQSLSQAFTCNLE